MNDLYVLVDHNQRMIIDHIKKLPEDWNNISGLNLLAPEKLYNLDWAGQTGLGWVSVNDNILNEYTSLPEWFEISKNGLKKLISGERWEKENEVLDFRGNNIEVNERTKSALNFQKAGITSETVSINWKFNNGFVSLTVSEFEEMYNFISQYIQGCFDEEQRLISLYDSANTLEELMGLELNENWPSTTASTTA